MKEKIYMIISIITEVFDAIPHRLKKKKKPQSLKIEIT